MPSRTGLWRTVRVFISSTFRDMQAERDHLVRVVFPALRERLHPHRVHLTDVDLRWGVTREQAENDRAVELCLRQIDECRPFFLCLLGERYGWVPGDGKESVTEREVRHALDVKHPDRLRALFAFRDPAVLENIPEPERADFDEADPAARQKLTELKLLLRDSVYPRLDPYPCRWDDVSSRLDGLEAFGEGVLSWLWDGLCAELGLADETPSAADPVTEEADHHERFLETRQRVYIGRSEVQSRLEQYAHDADAVPCVVTGPSGAGKSAVLARFVTAFRQRHPDVRVLPHFVGASPASTSLRGLLRRLCLELQRSLNEEPNAPEEPVALAEQFRELLWRLPANSTPTVLVIDGLNQLDPADQAHELHWLPEQLPPGVRLFVSSLAGSLVLDKLRSRPHREVRLDPLTDAERLAIVREVPSLSAKALDDEQVRLLLANPATANPLFLLTALEELRGFGSFDRLNERISRLPTGDEAVSLLFDQVLERLEQDFDEELVRAVLGLLASSRRGLSEGELRRLTDADDLYPVLRQLRPYLLSRGGLLGFYHGDLGRAVRRRYLATEDASRAAHLRLADHFATSEVDESRRVDELPWHLAEAGAWPRLHALLADLPFFDTAWQRDPFEVKRLWARLEGQGGLRRVEAYRPVLNAPERHAADTVGRVATLFADTGHPREAFRLRQHLVAHYRSSGDPARLAGALGNEALIRKAQGDNDGALQLLAEAEQLWRETGDLHGLQATLGNRARVLKMLGDLDGAMRLLQEAEQICRQMGNRNGLQITLGSQALILQARNDLDGALALLRERERICRETGNRHGLQIALGNQALILQARGEFEQALALLDESERICRELGNRHGLQVTLGSKAGVLQRQGRAEEAMVLLRQQEAICRELGNRLGLQIALTTQALIRAAAGDRDLALELLGESERICRELRNPEGLALALHHQSRLLEGAVARQRATEALEIAERHGLTALAALIRSSPPD